MHARAKTTIAVIGVAAVTLVGSDAMTYAGTGDSLILGKFNKSHRTTHVTNTGKGPALALHAKGDRPALTVDSNAKVAKLNADLVDGVNATGLRNNVRVYTETSGSSIYGDLVRRLPVVPKGRYLASYTVYLSGASGTGACYFSRPRSEGSPTVYAGYTEGASGVNGLGLSATDVINQASGRWQIHCYADGAWSIAPNLPVRVTLTRIDNTISGNLGAGRTDPDRGRPTDQ